MVNGILLQARRNQPFNIIAPKPTKQPAGAKHSPQLRLEKRRLRLFGALTGGEGQQFESRAK